MDKKEKSDLYKYLHKDVKEFNKYILSSVCVGILVLAGLLSYFITTSYAYFTDTIVGKKTIEAKVGLKNLDTSGANEPVLDDAMIPVYYDATSETWKKADKSNHKEKYKWYDYDNKMWANSVTVSSTNREKYKNAALGTEISMDDILTMQVWIPRYKYKVWNYNSGGDTGSSNPQEIKIDFETGTSSTGEIKCQEAISGSSDASSESCKVEDSNEECTNTTCNNKTYTHPAFTFGEKELTGFWAGKFEITGDINNITVKPNLSSIRNQTISTFETNIMNMKNSSNQYGLSTATDTHMIKNSEWGAVAYLSHSKYGTCTDGTCTQSSINLNSDYITGCGFEIPTSYTTTTECNKYNTSLGMTASTTMNIYGIYDMNGGTMEYVMANIVGSDGSTPVPSESGYTTSTYPDRKYYNLYSATKKTIYLDYSILGDAGKEVYNGRGVTWYKGGTVAMDRSYSWTIKGWSIGNSTFPTMFSNHSNSGVARDNYSTRLIITPQS